MKTKGHEMKKIVICGFAAVMCAAAASAEKPAAGAVPGAGGRARVVAKAKVAVKAGELAMPSAERRLVDAVEDAETMRELSRLMPQVLASRNPEVRQAMVDALEDKGGRGINELVRFMADSDAEVADSAFSAWTSLLEELPPPRRVAAIRAAAKVLQPPSPPAVRP